ncbi:NAD(P)/FAD-dependent oxidoreductase [Paraburkholderia sp. DD10]|jgi:gamma-glutamylputrescine oxidase|uniref:Gamma-glutamylputrescine oxidase n=1 Tax=Paraburkholderia terricola TaxID=169427 RepID=A0ABU1LUZ6_9BURK|nr:FAD-binding oxidoreductase [Paraburkholderia terricola]ORC49956.1 FAD-dependent oxidoreductase [Burkholderia sp. A27]AXE92903.1 FAD-binding oxidoreductase [Paraburkholderia terricola]MDR6410494.1 gamma-glutamylputrescine oxidase [Paraburkholderia terricola]MDR6447195.1 gamma-glutamylputrescine oxidase [Paraburkholderia terricola]MDR6481081.1 gamma-glutamylputrescine oxidase [Paraburkholderia terricola]
MAGLLQKELGVLEKSYYEASVVRAPLCAPLQESMAVDVCVIGAGYAGLSCALELARMGYTVALLEAHRIGWGASGRNGGQALVGFGAEGEHAIETQCPREVARAAWDASIDGMRLLRQRIGDYGIDCDYISGYLTLALRKRKSEALRRWVEHMARVYDYPLQWLDRAQIAGHLNSDRFVSGAYDAGSGHLHPLKYCLGLAAAARRAGVRLFENTAAFRLERGREPVVKTAEGEVRCRYVVLAGNVYLGEFGDELAPELRGRIMPVGTYMVATEPMGQARADALMPGRAAASDNNLVLDYFRLSADHRLLFGAGETYSAKAPRNLVERMRVRMTDVFPQTGDLGVEFAWGGFVDITMNRAPDLGRLGNNIYYVQGFSGHGLVFAGMAGKLMADSIAGETSRFEVFNRIRHRRFPGGAMLRAPGLVLGMWYYKLRDLL